MTTTDISALYTMCRLLMTEVVAKVILMTSKPISSATVNNYLTYLRLIFNKMKCNLNDYDLSNKFKEYIGVSRFNVS